MNRTTLHHTLAAIAALALLSAFASTSVSATERELMDKLGIMHRVEPRQIMRQTTHDPLGVSEPKVPKGLTTKKGPQQSGERIPSMIGLFVPNAGI
jgi:hypothetical protein